MKHALVTGAAGFLGRHVAQVCVARGLQVVGMGHGKQPQGLAVDAWFDCEIDLAHLHRHAGQPDLIVHCAGSGSVGFSLQEPFQDFQRSVQTTMAVLEYARQHAPEARVVYPSSAAVYGVTKLLPISETAAQNPFSPYGVHKQQAELACECYARHFSLRTAVVRLFSVYGQGLRKQLLWDACRKLQLGERSFFGTGEESRDWLHVQDAAQLLFRAGENASPACPTVNGARGIGVTVKEILHQLFQAWGSEARPEFTGCARSGDPQHYVADVERAHGWDWQPQISLGQGLSQYVEWFRSQA